MRLLDIHLKTTKNKLVSFIKREVKKAGFKKAILGLSGGVDSSCVAFLAKEALGKKNVMAVLMPYKTSNPDSLKDANLVIKKLDLSKKLVNITKQIDIYFKSFPRASRIRRGNKMARERMSVLYDLSAKYKALVMGTSNKTELLLGYGTIYGDVACAINPIGSLYKTQVKSLSKYLGVPDKIIAKPPSADLWIGQRDEEELGLSYEEVDRFLYLMMDKRKSKKELIKLGYTRDYINKVIEKIQSSAYKGRLPLIARL